MLSIKLDKILIILFIRDPDTSAGFNVLYIDTSLEKYADELARLVAFAIRTLSGKTKTEYRLPFTAKSEQRALDLEIVLRSDTTIDD